MKIVISNKPLTFAGFRSSLGTWAGYLFGFPVYSFPMFTGHVVCLILAGVENGHKLQAAEFPSGAHHKGRVCGEPGAPRARCPLSDFPESPPRVPLPLSLCWRRALQWCTQ